MYDYDICKCIVYVDGIAIFIALELKPVGQRSAEQGAGDSTNEAPMLMWRGKQCTNTDTSKFRTKACHVRQAQWLATGQGCIV